MTGWDPAQVARKLEERNFIRTTITMRTELVRRVGGWTNEYRDGVFTATGVPYEDWDLLIRLARAGARFRCVPFETWEYRIGFRITYSAGGAVTERQFTEGSWVSLPLSAPCSPIARSPLP